VESYFVDDEKSDGDEESDDDDKENDEDDWYILSFHHIK
jgi:hypothetical protein